MAVIIADKIHDLITDLKRQMKHVVTQCSYFINGLETSDFFPELADASVAIRMVDLSNQLQSLNDELNKYVLFQPQLQEEVDQVDDLIASFGDRFVKWMNRTTISVTEATLRFNRSRSTIYRLIKSGKINAIKIGRFWVIAV
jgi:excisionase family DNA binding protein